MGRHSSDSEEDRKKRKKKKKKRSRSRSRSSESKYSSKQKKSKKSKKKRKSSRSRSRSLDSHRRSRSRSKVRRSRSYDRYHSRSRSKSRSKYSRRSRSLSRGRYSRSRSRDRSKRRSRSYERHSRRSRSRSAGRKDRRKYSEEREDPCLTIPGFSELPPSEQAKIRMQMALKAAAAADEKIKGDTMERPTSFKDQMAFNQAIQDIESSGFEAQYFKSNSWEKKEDSTSSSKDEFTFGTAGEIKLDSYQKKPPLINVDTDDLADPSLHVDPEEKMDRWIQKLSAMRRRKLEGEALA